MQHRSARSDELWSLLRRNRSQIEAVLARYGARNPRVFGSVARGDATAESDVDLLVDLDQVTGADALWVLSGLGEDLRQLLGVKIDVVADHVLRGPVAASALRDVTELI